jgi:hypothetical protein
MKHSAMMFVRIFWLYGASFFITPAFANGGPSALSGGSITNNPINQTITSGSSPAQLTATVASGGHCGSYSYQWQESSDSVVFKDVLSATSQNYQPGAMTVNTYLRRKTTCGLGNSLYKQCGIHNCNLGSWLHKSFVQ